MATPEGKVKARVVKVLKEAGAWYCFPGSFGGRGRAGIPDVLFCLRGVFGAVECKAGRNTLTVAQANELNAITRSGGWSMVINDDPDTLEALRGWCEVINTHADETKAQHKALMDSNKSEPTAGSGGPTGDGHNDENIGGGERDPAA